MDNEVAQKLTTFFSPFNLQKYRKGEILIRADENPSGIFYLLKGTVKVYCISEKGDEIVLNIFKPASFFPMSWAINNVPNNYFYEAMTEIETRKAPKIDVVNFIKKNSDVLFDLLSRMYIGVDGLLTRMTYLMSGNAYMRLITEIIITAKRFGIKNGHQYMVKISEKDLALQAGLSRETVSREMKILKQKGLVSLNKKILEVIDINNLTNEIL